MSVKKVYEDGAIFEPKILDITEDDIKNRLMSSIANLASISMASGYIVKPAIPHLLGNAFKNLASVTFTSDYTFKQADALKEAAKNQVVAPKGGPVKAAAKEEVEEPKEEEADVDMGGLFGDDY